MNSDGDCRDLLGVKIIFGANWNSLGLFVTYFDQHCPGQVNLLQRDAVVTLVTKRRSGWACIGNPNPEQETIKGTHTQETPAYQRRPTTQYAAQGSNPPIGRVYSSMVWGTAAPLVGCLPAARQKACRFARNRKSFPLQRAMLSRRSLLWVRIAYACPTTVSLCNTLLKRRGGRVNEDSSLQLYSFGSSDQMAYPRLP